MDGKAARLKEKPTSIKISDICAWIETMDEALRCIQKDVNEVKDLIKKLHHSGGCKFGTG
ncbi:hypothetical protein GQ55_9G060500 [Panicum hallii var. hallii]|uniref:Uncharacterized protein n=1 Tax=Panicum hallii var. hallii TaxID=1504633 RepID=A0A2T7C065_9POAL|nr:hypothetical protein GQ55_9G060500 [Panicum hallii var. hallii]